MKFVSFIFAIHFSLLAVMPCSDKDNCIGNGKTTISCISENHCQDNEHRDGPCSPLCMCHCCGGVALIVHSKYIKFISFPIRQNSIYPESFISEVSISIWQPPKV